jgi:hypothetical protein
MIQLRKGDRAMSESAARKAFEIWASGVIYNDQPLPERKGIPYFLAEKAFMAGRESAARIAADYTWHPGSNPDHGNVIAARIREDDL